jgi:hypothetical protein
MVQKNVGTKAIQFIVKDIVLDFVLWPVWWYGTGLVEAFFRMIDTMKQANDETALTIWAKNIFVPMYGDYTWQGRMISFLMRVAQIIIRTFLFLGWCVFAIVVFLLWIVVPLFIIFQFLFNVIGVF